MNVIHGLAGIRPLVQHQAISALRHALRPSQAVRGGEEATQEVIVVQIRDRIHMTPRHDQEVNRRLRVEVGKGDDVVIPIKGIEVRVGDQPAEDAARQTISSNCPGRLPDAGPISSR